jgi:hypothetical protein
MSIKSANIGFLALSTLMGAAAQLVFKISLSDGMLDLLILGILTYLASSLLYFYVISRAHLSWAYGVGGLSYIFAVVLGALFIEQVPVIRWVGVMAITAGVLAVAVS